MKISRSLLSKICFITGFIFAAQFLFATDVIIRKDDQSPPPQPGPFSLETPISVTAAIDNDQLSVYFEWSVGNATLTVYDSTNQIVHQETVDTDSTLDVFIDTNTWDNGNYTIKISYGTTHLTGEFVLE